MIRKHFRLKRLVLGLAVAAIAAPSAQAMVEIGGPTGGEQAYQASHGIVWDTQAPGLTAAGAALANAKHDALPVPVAATTQSGDSFNWSDAGIGASVSFGAALLLLTAIGLGRRYRGRLDRSGLANA